MGDLGNNIHFGGKPNWTTINKTTRVFLGEKLQYF
jgi:hypothetical protein